MLNNEDFKWVLPYSRDIINITINDLNKSYINYFTKKRNKPKLKNRKSVLSFPMDYRKIKIVDNFIYISKLGLVKMKDNNRLPKGRYWTDDIKDYKFYDCRVKYDGKDWYLTLCMEFKKEKNKLNNFILGIDLGITTYATLSNGSKYKGINHTYKVKKLEKDIKKLDRDLMRKVFLNGKNYKSKNFKKIKKLRISKIIRLKNIRYSYIEYLTNEIIKLKPKKIIIEDLCITDMVKNKYLCNKIYNQSFSRFSNMLEYKCKKFGIELIKANRFYPSSKKCSKCGNIKKDLKLKDRIYKCNKCGLEIDRDLNASINLKNYKN